MYFKCGHLWSTVDGQRWQQVHQKTLLPEMLRHGLHLHWQSHLLGGDCNDELGVVVASGDFLKDTELHHHFLSHSLPKPYPNHLRLKQAQLTVSALALSKLRIQLVQDCLHSWLKLLVKDHHFLLYYSGIAR